LNQTTTLHRALPGGHFFPKVSFTLRTQQSKDPVVRVQEPPYNQNQDSQTNIGALTSLRALEMVSHFLKEHSSEHGNHNSTSPSDRQPGDSPNPDLYATGHCTGPTMIS
jgi:hypothetical protein